MAGGINEETDYSVKAKCPKCNREHITVFKLRHISDSVFASLSSFFRYEEHRKENGRRCPNSFKPPQWEPR